MVSPKYAYFLFLTSLISGCGYVFQGARTPNVLSAELGVHKIYLETPKNMTYKPGIEVLIYNEIQRTFRAGNRVQLVRDKSVADAILDADIVSASFIPNSLTSAESIFPVRQRTLEVTVATEYLATLICGFRLTKTDSKIQYILIDANGDPVKKQKVLWSTQLARTSRFLGNNQKGEFGTTSALINDSEFDRTLQDSAKLIAQELHDSLLVMF